MLSIPIRWAHSSCQRIRIVHAFRKRKTFRICMPDQITEISQLKWQWAMRYHCTSSQYFFDLTISFSPIVYTFALSTKQIIFLFFCFFACETTKNHTYNRICRTRKNIGMKPASLVIDAVNRWSINNSARKLRRFTAAIVMTHNSHHVAMAVAKYFVLVRIIHTNIFDHTFVVPFLFLFSGCVAFDGVDVFVLFPFPFVRLFLCRRSERIRLFRFPYDFVILFVILVVLVVFLMRTFISILCVFHTLSPPPSAPAVVCVNVCTYVSSNIITFDFILCPSYYYLFTTVSSQNVKPVWHTQIEFRCVCHIHILSLKSFLHSICFAFALYIQLATS